MTGPAPAVAAVRRAVRAAVGDLPAGSLVLVACSGGPDSLALAAATAFVAPRARLRAGAVVVDHGVQPGSGAVAREAADAALDDVAARLGAGAVLLGHTVDDQAETVLLGLARGSGARSLAGMRRCFGVFSRPLLGLTRAQTEQACRAQDIVWWTDPTNDDRRFARSRVRNAVLPVLE